MIINIPFVRKVTSVQIKYNDRAHAHARVALLLPCLEVNPTGLTERNSELVNGFYDDSRCGFMTNNLQENIYTI